MHPDALHTPVQLLLCRIPSAETAQLSTLIMRRWPLTLYVERQTQNPPPPEQ